jgi:transcription elongation factor GreA
MQMLFMGTRIFGRLSLSRTCSLVGKNWYNADSMQPILMTQSGKDEMQAELNERVNVIRPDVGARMAAARALGDLSENAEYHTSRDEARRNEGRIEEIQEILKRVRIIAATKHDRGELGAKMTLSKNGSEVVYVLVSAAEADIRAGKISIESPIGQLLVGLSAGQTFSHTTPGGIVEYQVISVE